LAALPALTALYWLRNSYQPVVVSSLMLWLHAAESRASGLRVRKLQTPLLFFLELLILTLLAVAAAEPTIEARGSPMTIAILDDSLSMRAGGEESSRKLGEGRLESELRLGSGGRVRFLLAGLKAQTLGDAVTSWAEARDLLAGWTCGAPAGRIAEALILARELGGDSVRLIVITDRPPAESTPPEGVEWHALGEPRGNVAIVRVGRTKLEDHDRCTVEVSNFSGGARSVTLVLSAGEKELSRQALPLGARESRRTNFRAPLGDAAYQVRIAESDALAEDNVAYLVREPDPLVRTEVQIKDEALRRHVDKGLAATGKTLPAGKEPKLLVTDAAEAPKDLASEVWVVQFMREAESDAFVGPFVVDRLHPLSEGLELEGMVWGAGKATEFPGAPIVMAGNVPLITESESSGGRRRLRVRLRPDLSTLPQTPAWPVLLWNVMRWRARELPGPEKSNLRLGESASIKTPANVSNIQVTAGDGTKMSVPVRASHAAWMSEKAGAYELDVGGEKSMLAVNVANFEESDLSNAATGKWGEPRGDASGAMASRSLTWILAAVALAAIVGHLALARRGR